MTDNLPAFEGHAVRRAGIEKQAAKAERAKASAEKKRTGGKVVDIRDGHGQG